MAITNNLKLLGQDNISDGYSTSIDTSYFAFKSSRAGNYTYLYTSDLNRLLQNASLPGYALTKWIETNYTTGENHTYDVGETPTTVAGYIKDDFTHAIVNTINTTMATTVNNVATLQGYFNGAKAKDAEKLNGKVDTYFAKDSDMTTANNNISTLQSYFTGSKATNAVTADTATTATTADSATNVNLTASGTGTDTITVNAGTGTATFTVNNVAKATTADKTANHLCLHRVTFSGTFTVDDTPMYVFFRTTEVNGISIAMKEVDALSEEFPCSGYIMNTSAPYEAKKIISYLLTTDNMIIHYINNNADISYFTIPLNTEVSDIVAKLAVSQ